MGDSLKQILIKEIEDLPVEAQNRVLEYVRAMSVDQVKKKNRSELMKLAGSISKEDAALMRKAIEEDCGRIDHDGW